MATTLQGRLGELALAFSESVLEAIRGASLEELFEGPARPRATAHATASPPAASRRRGGRLARRSASDIERVVAEIESLLREHPKGLRAEQIRRQLGLLAKELPRPLKEALESARLGKSGQKRATTYFLPGSRGGRAGRASPAKRRAAKGRKGKGRARRRAKR